jgi:MSHA biogenesis protein MshG
MPYFAYVGRDADGARVTGVIDVPSSAAAADQLAAAGIVPLDIRPGAAPDAGPAPRSLLERITREVPRRSDVMMFSRQLATLLRSGVPIMRGLAGLQESITNRGFQDVIRDLRQSLDSGRELSAALQRHGDVFSPFYCSMVRVGETTGQLEQVFMRLFHYLDFERLIREQVRSALRYPLFVIAAMAVALVIINLFVIPEFAKIYRQFNAELPLLTRVLIGFSDFMVASWIWLAAGAFGAWWLLLRWIDTPRGRLAWDRCKLRIPIAGPIVLKATLARFARGFALAFASGVPAVQALRTIAPTVDNRHIEARIDAMRDSVERGESVLRAAAASGVFTPVVLQMIAVGEESGALDEMLEEVGQMYQREVEYELKALGAALEPILIVLLGALVLVLALGVFLPIWDLGRTVMGRG